MEEGAEGRRETAVRPEEEGEGGEGQGKPGTREGGQAAHPDARLYAGAGVSVLCGGGPSRLLDVARVRYRGGRSPGQRRAGTEPLVQVEDEDTRAQSLAEGSLAQPGAGTLERASLPRGQTGPGATSGGRLAGASGLSRAPKSGSKKCKLGAAARYVSLRLFSAFLHTTPFWF